MRSRHPTETSSMPERRDPSIPTPEDDDSEDGDSNLLKYLGIAIFVVILIWI